MDLVGMGAGEEVLFLLEVRKRTRRHETVFLQTRGRRVTAGRC